MFGLLYASCSTTASSGNKIIFVCTPSSQLLSGDHTFLMGSKLFTEAQSQFMGCWIPVPSDLDSVGEGYIMLFVVYGMLDSCSE